MSDQTFHPASRAVQQERAVLVGVELPGHTFHEEKPLEELSRLTRTAGAVDVARIVQKRRKPVPATYIGKGKVQEVGEALEEAEANVVIFDNDLSPAQQRTLEKELEVKVLDRSEIILDIFALRAQTRQARLEVEVAQLIYQLPRLRNLWTHLDRHGGGIGTRGPGEQELETDRRIARKRLADLRRELQTIQGRRDREIESRDIPTVCLVGYTNAGKSTLMNALTNAAVKSEDKLFATVDTRTRVLPLGGGRRVLLADTVGFISRLPHHLVASFHATLAAVRHAALLLHVVDVSHPSYEQQMETVSRVLTDLEAGDRPMLNVFNKIDAMPDPTELEIVLQQHSDAVAISAHTGAGLSDLMDALGHRLSENHPECTLEIPVTAGAALAAVQRGAEVVRSSVEGENMHVRVRISRALLSQLLVKFPAIKRT